MKKVINNFLRNYGYRITNVSRKGKRYPDKSQIKGIRYYETPIGDYYLPGDAVNDSVADAMSRGKLFEPEITDTAKQYIRKGDTVLDVGANFGQMTILFSELVGEQGDIYSFEAQEEVYNILEKNIKANRCFNVNPVKNAVHK